MSHYMESESGYSLSEAEQEALHQASVQWLDRHKKQSRLRGVFFTLSIALLLGGCLLFCELPNLMNL